MINQSDLVEGICYLARNVHYVPQNQSNSDYYDGSDSGLHLFSRPFGYINNLQPECNPGFILTNFCN